MAIRRAAALLVVILACGCGPRTITVSSPADADRASREIKDQCVTMKLTDGTRASCEPAVVRLDTCTCVDARAGTRRRVPTSDVESITAGRPGRGALWGFIIGAGAGELMGALDYLTNPGDDIPWAGMVIGPIVGGLFGLVFGPLTTLDIYELDTGGPESTGSDSSGRSVRPLE